MRNHNQIGNDLGFDKYSIMCLVSICVSFDLWIAVGGLAAFSNKMFDIQSFQTKNKDQTKATNYRTQSTKKFNVENYL